MCEKSRASKHTAKQMALFYAELANTEKKYALALQRLGTAREFGEDVAKEEG